MKQINLLPGALRQHRYIQKVVTLFSAVALCGMGVVVLIWLSLHAELTTIQAQVNSLQALRQQEVARQLSSSASGAPSTDVLTRVDQLNTLSKSEINWVRALSQIAQLTPKDIRLVNYSLASATGSLAVKITGEAPSNLSFAEFIQSLRDNPNLTGTKVDAYSYVPSKGLVTFSLSTVLKADQVNYPSK